VMGKEGDLRRRSLMISSHLPHKEVLVGNR
jgi:hypothetical protein